MDPDRIYRHFCMTARALEVVGDRWSLLIVRDLLFGRRRFTDLERSLAAITATRLTGRLRQLETAGIVTRRSQPRGRVVWYELTEAGRDLGPVVDALTLWGIQHARRPPVPGEPVHAEPVMIGTKVWLARYGAAPGGPATWVWRFGDEDAFTLRFGDRRWELDRGAAEPASVTVVAAPEAWARFLTTPGRNRRLPRKDIRLEAPRAEARRFAKAFRAELAAT
jgi:DNA-binding HxlR family transcriptional regulator